MFLRVELIAFVCVNSRFNADLNQYSFSTVIKQGERTVWINLFIKKEYYSNEEAPKKGEFLHIEGSFN